MMMMRQAMAGGHHGGLVSAGDSTSRVCKRSTVVFCAIANLAVTVYVLQAWLLPSSSTSYVNCLRRWSPYGSDTKNLTKLREMRAAANEFRRQAAPLELIRRVKEIEEEVTKDPPKEASVEKSEQEELQEQVEVETGPQVIPSVEDDELGVIERLLPPECHPEPNTDFGGVAVRWGLNYHVGTAAECCKACLMHAAYAERGQLKCNVWVFCPDNNGCKSPDGYEHKFGECWLKHADRPQATVHDYSRVMHDLSPSPLPVLWISGATTSNGS